MSITLRSERPSDTAAIDTLIAKAFLDAPHASHTEHFIVGALREAGQLSLSLVATDHGDIVGHVAVSPVAVSEGTEGWYGLGPVSVAPERQGQGIGARLVQQALAELRRLGAEGCVVLGEPAYYGRFGFKAVPELVLPDVPPEYFQAVAFRGAMPAGTIAYHAAFDSQG